MSLSAPIPPGSVIGILGAGQLGRMLGLAAASLGYRTAFFCPDPGSPAFQIAERFWREPYGSRAALAEFADAVDLITYEFENVPATALDFLEDRKPIRPGRQALAISQDRLCEKDFLSRLGLPVAPYRAVEDLDGLKAAINDLSLPAILKTRRLGYDGKGQARIMAPEEAAGAWAKLNSEQAILEALIPFDCEISVLLARNPAGDIACWPPVLNVHQEGILRTSEVPAPISSVQAARAEAIARRIADALDFIGVMAVEMFLIAGRPEPLVNEIAPRVHNSGHWTLDGSRTDQFEQHIRAICGLPLGAADVLGRVRMENLIGDEAGRWHDLLSDPTAKLHLYGKSPPRPGRKMGHVTWLRTD